MKLTITNITANGIYEDGTPFVRTSQMYMPLYPGDTMEINYKLDYNWEVEPDKLSAPTLQKPQD